ncbi:MAG: ATP-binding protein [Candidatus Scalindua sp.]|nr:ATP-binding protein [Candidatus Scalindua sp.]
MKTSEVFGVSNKQVASYIDREEVDTEFIKGLERNKHIIIFGASKQGKTALTNKHLHKDQFVRVNCAPQTTSIDIYKSILRQLDVEFEEERTEKNPIETSAKVSLKVKVKIPIFASGEAGAEGGGIREKETEKKIYLYRVQPYSSSRCFRNIKRDYF